MKWSPHGDPQGPVVDETGLMNRFITLTRGRFTFTQEGKTFRPLFSMINRKIRPLPGEIFGILVCVLR